MRGAEVWRAGSLAALLGFSVGARADAPRPGVTTAASSKPDDTGAAQALFEEGRRLATNGNYREACARFEQSLRLDQAAGTLVNLADCYERSGKLASAWIAFREASSLAERTGRSQWAQQAQERAALVEPKVPTLALTTEGVVAELQVRRDGVLVDRSTWGTPVPVDPGEYALVAAAPGRASWSSRVALEPAAHVVIRVPALLPEASASVIVRPLRVPAAPDRPRATGTVQRTIAVGAAAISVLPLALGTYLGVLAITHNDEAGALCPTSPRCTDMRAVTLTDESRNAATGSTVAFATGGVLLAAAGVLFLTAPTSSPLTLRVGATSAALVGRW